VSPLRSSALDRKRYRRESSLEFRLSLMPACGIIGGVKTYQTLLWAFAFFAAFADGQPFDRYQTIIDRKPFGPEPANFDPEAAPGTVSAGGAVDSGEMTPEQRTAEEQKLASNVRVSILNVAPDGTVKVGFTDSSANPPENYYLKVGGSQNGWMVKGADPAAESVTLEKDGVEVTMKLGEGTGGKGGGAKDVAKGGALRRGISPAGGNMGVRGAGGAPGAPARMGGLARLRQHRMEMEAKQREDAERKREADAAIKAEQAEREAAEEAERQRAAEERQRAAEDRAQQREALLQIQEQLRKQREEREAARQTEGEQEEPE